jgi:CBS domain-containing protein
MIMSQTVEDVMTAHPVICSATAPLTEAARMMRDHDIGDVLVERDGQLCGLVTDRDIVVRAVADGKDVSATELGDVCSKQLVTLAPTDSVKDAVRVMRDKAIRRVPVIDHGKPVGIVSLGDLAIERGEDSALADISAASPNT